MTDAFLDLESEFNDTSPVPYRRVPGLALSLGSAEGEEAEYFLKARTGPPLILGERERLLWLLLDGSMTFGQIRRRFQSEFGHSLTATAFAKFLHELIQAGAVERVSTEPRKTPDGSFVRKIELADNAARADGGPAIPFPGERPGAGRRGRGAMRGGGQRGTPIREAMRTFWSFRLGNPERLLDRLTAIYWPIRYVGWLLIPLLLFASLITIKHSAQYYADWTALIVSIPVWPCLWAAEHVTTWSGRVVEGMVVHGFGGRITEARVKVFLGIFIRLQFDDESSTAKMSRRQKLWIAATPLIWRLVTFAVSIVVWVMYRPTHPMVAQVAMFMAAVGLITFVICACPLIPLYGYKFLATLLDQENLRGRAFQYLALKMRGQATPDAMSVAERWGLLLMAVGTALITSLYFLHILYHANSRAIDALGGFGFWIGLSLLGLFVLYVVSLYRYAGKLRAMQRVSRTGGAPPPGLPDRSLSRTTV